VVSRIRVSMDNWIATKMPNSVTGDFFVSKPRISVNIMLHIIEKTLTRIPGRDPRSNLPPQKSASEEFRLLNYNGYT
jgi:hypothetical protein